MYFLFGTARDVTVGPTAIMSLVVSNACSHDVHGNSLVYDAAFLCFLAGLIQMIMSIFRLGMHTRTRMPDITHATAGFLIDFISEPVVSAFTSASGLTIAAGQLRVRQSCFVRMPHSSYHAALLWVHVHVHGNHLLRLPARVVPTGTQIRVRALAQLTSLRSEPFRRNDLGLAFFCAFFLVVFDVCLYGLFVLHAHGIVVQIIGRRLKGKPGKVKHGMWLFCICLPMR